MFVAVSLPRTLSRFESATVLPLGLTEAILMDFDGCVQIPASGRQGRPRECGKTYEDRGSNAMPMIAILLSAQIVTKDLLPRKAVPTPVSRVARLMALAIRLEMLVRLQVIPDS
jgi:hypothetical protein